MKCKALILVGTFLVSSLAASAGAPRGNQRKLVDQWFRCLHTLQEMRAIQTAIEAYGVDHPTFPIAKTMEELRALVQPGYIATSPMTDDWGTPLRYVVSPNGASYRLISAGSDQVFEDKTWSLAAFLSDSSSDAVLTSEGWAADREWVIQE